MTRKKADTPKKGRKKTVGLTKGELKILTVIFVKLLKDTSAWEDIARDVHELGEQRLDFLVDQYPCWFPNYLTAEGVQLQVNRAWWQALQQIGNEYGLRVVQQETAGPGVTFMAIPAETEV
jgi:hypothetical protein